MIEDKKNPFIERFKNRLDQVANKGYLIQNEITQIEITVNSDESWQEHDQEPWLEKEKPCVFHLKQVGTLLFFNSVFHHYLIHNESDTILGKGMREDESIMATVEEAVQFADYYTWLKSLNNGQSTPKAKSALSHKEKMLALHYLGLDLSKFDNTKSGNVLGEILGMDKENTRKYLSYVAAGKNEVRTKKNMQTVLKLFESQHLTEISERIKADIESQFK